MHTLSFEDPRFVFTGASLKKTGQRGKSLWRVCSWTVTDH